jgi:hypothetical protein
MISLPIWHYKRLAHSQERILIQNVCGFPNAVLFKYSPAFKTQRAYCFHRNRQTGQQKVLLQALLLHLPLDLMPMSALSRTI